MICLVVCRFICIFATENKLISMDTSATLHINNALLTQAMHYAKENEIDLSSVVNDFLYRFIVATKTEMYAHQMKVSDKVRSLAHRLPTLEGKDLSKEKEQFFIEKYGL